MFLTGIECFLIFLLNLPLEAGVQTYTYTRRHRIKPPDPDHGRRIYFQTHSEVLKVREVFRPFDAADPQGRT